MPYVKHNNNVGRNILRVSNDENYSDASLHGEYLRELKFPFKIIVFWMSLSVVWHFIITTMWKNFIVISIITSFLHKISFLGTKLIGMFLLERNQMYIVFFIEISVWISM
jgi:hypothetical protein